MELRELLILLLFCFSDGHILTHEAKQDETCGYASCHQTNPNLLNVHLVAHSHDDVGWLKTVDQYYAGMNRAGWTGGYLKEGVGDILDSVLRALSMDSDRKFIFVETAFFWKWWNQQTQATKDVFTALVNNGQIEFVGGGWSMNDEGATHYVGIIDQMTLGLRILNQTFGECGRPKVAWHVDTFGHSKEQANIFQMMGFEGFFFGRLDHRDKENRVLTRTMEMMWETTPDDSDPADVRELFTGVNYNLYQPPEGFCWDIYCSDEPMMDNPKLKES